MITKDELSAACRAHDNAADMGEGLKEILAKRDVSVPDAFYVGYQRAMRIILVFRGKPMPAHREPVELSAAEKALASQLAVMWLDGLIVGLKVSKPEE